MSFSTKSAERFGTVIDKSPYTVEDALKPAEILEF